MKKILAIGIPVVALAILFGLLTKKAPHTPSKYDQLINNVEKEPKPEFPGEAAAYMAELLQTRNGENPAVLAQQAVNETKDRSANRGAPTAPNLKFEQLGPGNFGGRIRAIAVNPVNPDIILIGGVMGGVWKTLDGGLTWEPINDFLPNLAISSMTIDPNNSDRVFAGTGEGFFNSDAARGNGIYVSEDFGNTWSQLVFTNNNTNFQFVNRIAVNDDGSIVAATRSGLYRSTDNGASFSEQSGVSTSSRGFTDVKKDPSSPGRLYAVHFGGGTASFVMRSDNSGSSWTQLGAAEGLPAGSNLGRMELDIANDGVIYVSVADNSSSSVTLGLWRSTAGGNAFAKTPSNANYIPRQGWYDLMVGVAPDDSDRVYLGAVDVSRTTDAGATINQITVWNPNGGQLDGYVHADIHNIAFHPTDSMTLWITCDGGIFKSTDGGDKFVSLNNNLNITQYYGFDIHPTEEMIIGGTQDNGTHMYFGEDRVNWWQWFGGDGGYCSWDQQQPNFVYGATPFAGIYGSSNMGSGTGTLSLPNTTGSSFITPFTIDHQNGDRMMLGTDNVFYTENLRSQPAVSWTDASGSIGTIRALAFNPHDASSGFAGTSNGQVHRSTNLDSGTPSFSLTSLSGGGVSTWFEVDPHDLNGDTIYATFAGFGPDKVYKSTDQGVNWTSIHGDLPNIPVYTVSVDPNNPARLYLGTEIGMFTTEDNTNGGPFTWEHYDYGAAWTRIMQIRWRGDTMYFCTHGRGIYKATFNTADVAIGPIDDSGCDDDGYLDLGETVMIPFTLTNQGGFDMTNTQATLSANTVDIAIANPTQNYGSIAPGASETMNFEVTLNQLAACLDTATLTVTVSYDGGTGFSEDVDITIGANPMVMSGTFSDGAEGASLMTHGANFHTDDWAQVATQAHSGSNSWFTSDPTVASSKFLASPWLTVDSAASQLSFWLFYDTEHTPAGAGTNHQPWDGALLEIQREGESWRQVTTSLPYDGLFFTGAPLGLLPAWSDTQTTWRQGTVSLSDYNGDDIRFRFHFASDSNTGGVGFWVDDIEVTNVTWLSDLECDTTECLDCFGSLPDALDAFYTSLGNNEWPSAKTIADYVAIINNVCIE